MLLLETEITSKERLDDENAEKLDAGDKRTGEYEVEAIWNSAVYARELESSHLPGLYYLVSWKGYLEEENTWKPASTVQHLRKLISLCHTNHPDKPTTTFPAIDTIPLMARLTVKPIGPLNRKQERPTGHAKKRAKWRRDDKKEVTKRNSS